MADMESASSEPKKLALSRVLASAVLGCLLISFMAMIAKGAGSSSAISLSFSDESAFAPVAFGEDSKTAVDDDETMVDSINQLNHPKPPAPTIVQNFRQGEPTIPASVMAEFAADRSKLHLKVNNNKPSEIQASTAVSSPPTTSQQKHDDSADWAAEKQVMMRAFQMQYQAAMAQRSQATLPAPSSPRAAVQQPSAISELEAKVHSLKVELKDAAQRIALAQQGITHTPPVSSENAKQQSTHMQDLAAASGGDHAAAAESTVTHSQADGSMQSTLHASEGSGMSAQSAGQPAVNAASHAVNGDADSAQKQGDALRTDAQPQARAGGTFAQRGDSQASSSVGGAHLAAKGDVLADQQQAVTDCREPDCTCVESGEGAMSGKPTGGSISLTMISGMGAQNECFYLEVMGALGHQIEVILEGPDNFSKSWKAYGQLYSGCIDKKGGMPTGSHVQVTDTVTGEMAHFELGCKAAARR